MRNRKPGAWVDADVALLTLDERRLAGRSAAGGWGNVEEVVGARERKAEGRRGRTASVVRWVTVSGAWEVMVVKVLRCA